MAISTTMQEYGALSTSDHDTESAEEQRQLDDKGNETSVLKVSPAAKNRDDAAGEAALETRCSFLQELAVAYDLRKNLASLVVREERHRKTFWIDGVRAAAAIGIVFYHSIQMMTGGDFSNPMCNAKTPSSLLQIGMAGDTQVNTFLVLSGFLAAQTQLRARHKSGGISLGPYLYSRWLRMAPGYYTALIIYVIADSDHSARLMRENESWLWGVAFIEDWQLPFTGEPVGVPIHFWYISVQMQLYVLTPFLVWCVYGRERRLAYFVLASLFMVFTGVKVICYYLTGTSLQNPSGESGRAWAVNHVWTVLPVYLAGFMAYMACEDLGTVDALPRVPRWTWRVLGVVTIGGCLYFMLFGIGLNRGSINGELYADNYNWGVVVFLFGKQILGILIAACCFLFMASDALHCLRTLFESHVWTPLSRLSYGTYMMHLVLPTLIRSESSSVFNDWLCHSDDSSALVVVRGLGFVIVVLTSGVVLALLSHLFVEAPIVYLKSWLTPLCLTPGYRWRARAEP